MALGGWQPVPKKVLSGTSASLDIDIRKFTRRKLVLTFFFFLKDKVTGEEKEDTFYLWFTLLTAVIGLAKTKIRDLELHPGLSHVCQAPNSLGCFLLLSQMC